MSVWWHEEDCAQEDDITTVVSWTRITRSMVLYPPPMPGVNHVLDFGILKKTPPRRHV